MSVTDNTPYDKGHDMITMANIILQDMRRQAQAERLAQLVHRPARVLHLGPFRVTVDRNARRAA